MNSASQPKPYDPHNNSTRFLNLVFIDGALLTKTRALFKNADNAPITEIQLANNLFYGPAAAPITAILQLLYEENNMDDDLHEMSDAINNYTQHLQKILDENEKKKEDDQSRLPPQKVELLTTYKNDLNKHKKQLLSLEANALPEFNQECVKTRHAILDHALEGQNKIIACIKENFGINTEQDTIANQALAVVLSAMSLQDLIGWGDATDPAIRTKLTTDIESITAMYEKGTLPNRTQCDLFYRTLLQLQQKYNKSSIDSGKKGLLASLKGSFDLNALTNTIQTQLNATDGAVNTLLNNALNKGKSLEQKLSLIAKASSNAQMIKAINESSISDSKVNAIAFDEAKAPDSPQSAAIFRSKTG
jgi:hypothetical protein